MMKMLKWFAWLLVLIVLLAGIDQALLRLPLDTPGLYQVQRFYRDFRSRLLALAGGDGEKQSIEQLIESTGPQEHPQGPNRRYLYVDENGELQFADSFEQIPVRYRNEAQPLAE
jgi:hypothetical protein